jgi:predicted KAP-like P-loop ATPase
MIMAINGAWGSGKSTQLNFVKYELESLPPETRPVVIDFNPWWFDNHQALAGQFLAQFSSKLPEDLRALRGIGDTISDYAESLGTVLATATGHVWLKIPATYIAKLLHRKVKDVPSLKAQIAQALKEAGRRFVFIVDDIDRLDAEEIRAVFKVIKALANFPNVIYLLAFDRQTVAGALSAALKMDGEAYLEKIVQAPFSLPAIDRSKLRQKLFQDLERVLAVGPTSPGDGKYWSNVYYDGLDAYINKPRDLVRLTNALSVTYPAVAGEVNFVDFIALEFLRIFEPAMYVTIRDNPHYFTGLRSDRSRRDNDPERLFHESWLLRLPEERREAGKALMKRLFPRLDLIWGNTGYSSESVVRWRRLLRACTPEAFDAYFRFGVTDDSLSRRELNELLASATDPARVSKILVDASAVVRAAGVSKAREYVSQLLDLKDEISPAAAEVLLTSILEVGDTLFNRVEVSTDFFPSRWRLIALVNHLLKRIAPDARSTAMGEAIRSGHAATLALSLVDSIGQWRTKGEGAQEPLGQIDENQAAEFKTVVVQKLRALPDQALSRLPELDLVTHRWRQWDDPTYVAARMGALVGSDDFLPLVLEGFLRFGTSQSINDAVATPRGLLNPRDFEAFTDIKALEPRVRRLLDRADLSTNQRAAAQLYLNAMELISRGKDPSSPFAYLED